MGRFYDFISVPFGSTCNSFPLGAYVLPYMLVIDLVLFTRLDGLRMLLLLPKPSDTPRGVFVVAWWKQQLLAAAQGGPRTSAHRRGFRARNLGGVRSAVDDTDFSAWKAGDGHQSI